MAQAISNIFDYIERLYNQIWNENQTTHINSLLTIRQKNEMAPANKKKIAD